MYRSSTKNNIIKSLYSPAISPFQNNRASSIIVLSAISTPTATTKNRGRNNCGLPSQVELSSTTPDFLPHAFVRWKLCYYYYDLSFLFAVKAKSYKHALSYVKARDHAVPRLCTALLRRSRLLLSSKSRALYSDILRFSAFVMGRIGRGR